MAETRQGQEADPLADQQATEALVEALESYLPPTTERGKRQERLRALVTLLARKGCSNAEVVRVLRKRGVLTSWRTVKKLRPADLPAPLPPYQQVKQSAPGGSGAPGSESPKSLEQVQL